MRNGSADFRSTDEVSALFGAPDHDCIIRATARSGDIFDAAALAQLRDTVGRLREIAGVEDVRSIFDVRRQGAAGALLPVIPHTRAELDGEARAAAKVRATRHPLVAGHLLSADAASSLLLVRLATTADRLEEDRNRFPTIIAQLKQRTESRYVERLRSVLGPEGRT